MGFEIFLINEAFVASFLLAIESLSLLVFLERVEMFEKVGSLGWTGIVKGNMDIKSAWSLEGIVKPVGVVGRRKENRVFLSLVSRILWEIWRPT
jgi:hypothetical protein